MVKVFTNLRARCIWNTKLEDTKARNRDVRTEIEIEV